jgi:acetate kinase
MVVLVVNAGSSSLKLRLLGDDDELLAASDVPAPGGRVDPALMRRTLAGHAAADAVGHRVVHGGTRYRDAVVVDGEVVEQLHALTDLAPLHQPKSLAALEAATAAIPRAPHVACFDTAFHATLPQAAATYALPRAWRQRWGLRRYGFHGLSHAYATRRAAELLGAVPDRLVTCHLGAGASLAAVAAGSSVDTTMGFTPLEGLVMATRAGSVDPGLLLWLLERRELTPAELGEALEHASGVAALAGTPDMAEVVIRADGGDEAAAAALDVYLHRLCGSVAQMAAALGGLDALVFTGGVGENSPPVRERAAARLAFLGVALDAEANRSAARDGDIAAAGARVRTLVVRAREDVEIARQVRACLRANRAA